MPPEQVVGMARNERTASIGIAGRHGPDYALDCAGNVWEWTTSRVGEDQIVIRGGSWNFYAEDARCFTHDHSRPGHRSNRIGFRVATGPLPQEESAPDAQEVT